MVPVVSRPRVVAVYHPRVHQLLLADQPSKLTSERFIETQRVAISLEPQKQDEKKPELKSEFRPTRKKLRAKTSKISLRQHSNANISQTVQDYAILIGSASPKSNLAHPTVISQAHFNSSLARKPTNQRAQRRFRPYLGNRAS